VRPELEWSRRGEGQAQALRGALRRRTKGRRLAYVDSHLPWNRGDALAVHELRPDTVFFSLYPAATAFPAEVLPLASFPRVAPGLGITDVHGAGLDFLAGIAGLRRGAAPSSPDQGLDLSPVLRDHGIRLHAGLYPDAGATDLDEARRLAAAATTTLTWIPDLIAHVEGVTPIAPAVIDTGFFAATERDFTDRPLQLLFRADDDRPDTGLDAVLAAFAPLTGEPLHLHVAGPHDPQRAAAHGLGPDRVTFHGPLDREPLRDLHRRCHVVLAPARAADPGDFPGVPAAEAMSSGLLLLTDPDALADALRGVLAEPAGAARDAAAGAVRVRERYDVRRGAADRLALMGFAPDGARSPYAPPRRDAPAAPVLAPPAPAHAAPDADLETLRAGQQALTDQVQALRTELAAAEAARAAATAELRATQDELLQIARVIRDDEPATRRLLAAARNAPDYERPFTEPDPLVTICIPTYNNTTALLERSIPSALAQDHPNVEVVVVGDTAPPETAAGIEALNDPRVRYENLSVRGPYPDDPRRRWFVAGTGPLNRAYALARGSWIAVNNDDDALRPDHVSTLLAAARASRDEVVYGQLLQHAPDGATQIIGAFPPTDHNFGWQLTLQHRAMLLFEYELSAHLFGVPGDWDRALRMLRAGVRFGHVEAIVGDYYPSTLWGEAQR
jgi:hypothetical protein